MVTKLAFELPTLLILDEPSIGVDPPATKQFWDLISHICFQSVTKAHQTGSLIDRDSKTTAIEEIDITMRFADFVAVDHVNCQIRRGDIFGFIGPSGCGKTTTMKMLTGPLKPTQGRVL